MNLTRKTLFITLLLPLSVPLSPGCGATSPATKDQTTASANAGSPAHSADDTDPQTHSTAANPGAANAPASPPTSTVSDDDVEWSELFGGQEGCFAMLSTPDNTWVISDEKRCGQAFRPFSTFKIANALVGLETGVLAGADTVIEWDPKVYPAADWWPVGWRERNDLRSAFQRSALPYFRALATRIGAPTMKRHVEAFRYGNADTSGGTDLFWLSGGLAISAVQQIEFLRALHEGRLPVAERTRSVVEDIMVIRRNDTYTLRGKTGTGMNEPDHALGWFVGYVERSDDVHYFAINRSGRKFADIPRKRTMAMADLALAALGVVPKAAE